MQVYDNCIPLVQSGQTVTITVGQTLRDGGTDLLSTTGPNQVKLTVQGPQTKLDPTEVAGVYPAPDSTDSPDEFLPHIALTRRTLPWERTGPGPGIPWLALLLVTDAELHPTPRRFGSFTKVTTATTMKDLQIVDALTLTQFQSIGIGPAQSLNTISIPNATLAKILPAKNEIASLCHMKRTTTNGVDTDNAIVICNRLPDAGAPGTTPQRHTALLVSLEGRSDLYGNRLQSAGSTTLTVLHQWSFTPSQEGDFEAVMQKIAVRPNGGVLRFGNLPAPAAAGATVPLSGGFQGLMDTDGYLLDPLVHSQDGNVIWRSPLRPFAPPPRSKGFAVRAAPEEFEDAAPGEPLDYSHASAFELGRLLALSDTGIREDLRGVRAVWDKLKELVATSIIPAVFQKPDWVVDPAWSEDPWSFAQQGLDNSINQVSKGDVTGISQQQIQSWQTALISQLGAANSPVVSQVSQIDIATVAAADLEKQFGEVINAAIGG